jgi:curved DNA-binding protein CbpA
LAQRYHPDRLGQDPAALNSRMTALNQAYATLSCPERRRAYDQWRRHVDLPHRVAVGQLPVNVLTTYDRRGRLHAYI